MKKNIFVWVSSGIHNKSILNLELKIIFKICNTEPKYLAEQEMKRK